MGCSLIFEQYGLQNLIPENALSVDGYGSKIFSIYTKKIDYVWGAEQFEQWLSSHKLI